MDMDTNININNMPSDKVDSCHLLGGKFAVLVQLSLGMVSLLALFVKWRRESHRRTLEIWKYDVLKQVVASLFAHFMNLIVAFILAKAGNEEEAECPWYFVNFTFDTFLGIPLATCLLYIFQYIASTRCLNLETIKESGYYGTPPQVRWWLHQV